jgi:processive 1,2-diacylglycerol beta-glucosyltransferase
VSDGYLAMVARAPAIYRAMYLRAERATSIDGPRARLSAYTARNLRALIGRLNPRAVVCTHAFPCGVMAAYKRLFDPTLPVIGVVTDFVVHPFWIYPNIDAYAVATEEMAEALAARGVAPERITRSGIPVDARFAATVPSRDAIRARLGFARDEPVVLAMVGGAGLGAMDTMIAGVERARAKPTLIAIAGRNARLRTRIARRALTSPIPIRALGFVDDIDEYMRAADVLVTKPGGLSTSEALAAEIPMILVQPLPGQEERNLTYLTENDAARPVLGAAAIGATIDTLLTDGDPILRAGMARVRMPDAARTVADLIVRVASEVPSLDRSTPSL